MVLDQEHDPLRGRASRVAGNAARVRHRLVEAQVQHNILSALRVDACLDARLVEELLAVVAEAEVF